MRGYIIDKNGNEYMLPMLHRWKINRTNGGKCDSFEASFHYSENAAELLKNAVRFYGLYEGERVFFGVIDEFALCCSDGYEINLYGRGLGALLMDNEAEAAEFYICSLEDILERYVKSTGITSVSAGGGIPPLRNFAVSSGESCYSALLRYTEKAAGITPRFSADGTLILQKGGESRILINDKNPVSDVVYREKRYGRVSEAVVKTARGKKVSAADSGFISLGGSARRITLVPIDTSDGEMRYKAQEIINSGKKGKRILELSLSALFAAEPGDKASVRLGNLGINGDYVIDETEVWAGENSAGTKLYLEVEE